MAPVRGGEEDCAAFGVDPENCAAFGVDPENCAAFGVVRQRVDDDTAAPVLVAPVVEMPPADADGDGHTAANQGGDDCNDNDAQSHPGARDRPYDGVDQDCSGADLDDLDHDGWRGVRADGGDDCNDGDPSVHPGVAEVCNVHDDDCDGQVDDGCPTARAVEPPGGIWWACSVVPPPGGANVAIPAPLPLGGVASAWGAVGGSAWCWALLGLVIWRRRLRS